MGGDFKRYCLLNIAGTKKNDHLKLQKAKQKYS